MTDLTHRDHATLRTQLTAALSRADDLGLTLVAIHIDEALSLLDEITPIVTIAPAASLPSAHA